VSFAAAGSPPRGEAKAQRDFFADFSRDQGRGPARRGRARRPSSRIGKAGRIYYNTLLDENAAAHIAFGAGFSHTRTNDDTNRARRGVNRSDAHVDVMIGTDDFEATASPPGTTRALIADGEWQI
jgi:aminopeptidase